MIFEKQAYQQKCLEHIHALLKDYDFASHSNLKECLTTFYQTHPQPSNKLSDKLNVDILMETGTGKTFTYLNLIFELHKTYKQNKFIIFVPRKAILESVRQNIKLTSDYFYREYEKRLKPYFYSDTKSQSAIINHYIKNADELSVLVLTNSAMDKKDNILNQSKESLFNDKSIFENIIDLKPISIIDEPHLLKGEAFNKYFSKLQSLYFRFGATFPKEKAHELSNMVYCLDSISSFRNYLVKQVRVHHQSAQKSGIIFKSKQKDSATFINLANNKEIQLKINDDCQALDRGGVNLVKIEADRAYLSNHEIIEKEEAAPLQKDEISRILGLAIDLHFEKEEKLFTKGIKALSLFFIPNVSDFRGEDAFVRKEFEKLYKIKREAMLKKDLSQDYRAYLLKDFDESGRLRVCNGYFNGDSGCKGNSDEKEAQDVRLILEGKQKLLSFQTSLRFIFSVWALQEGWDNPNIFTLIKLANSNSQISTHQQVGRGLRLCVNQEGKRITHDWLEGNDEAFYNINYLDVVVNSKEMDFIERLQKEVEELSFEMGGEFLCQQDLENILNQRQNSRFFTHLEDAKILEFTKERDAYKILSPIDEFLQSDAKCKEILEDQFDCILEKFRKLKNHPNRHQQFEDASAKKQKIKIRKNLAKDFKELWDWINKKAIIIYKDLQEEALIDAIAKDFQSNPIKEEHLTYTKKILNPSNNKIETEDTKTLDPISYEECLKKDIHTLLLDFANEQKLPLSFCLHLYNAIDKKNFYNSPPKAFKQLKDSISNQIHSSLLQSIDYDFTRNTFSSSDPLIENGEIKQEIDLHILGKYKSKETPPDNYLYESIVYDSEIEKEVSHEDYKHIESIRLKVFAKLPKLSIPTPYKNYEPDFAYFLQNSEGGKIFFICETKGYNKESDIPEPERKKISYAEKFFEKLQESVKDQNITIEFKKRINKQSLQDVLKEILQRSDHAR